MAKSDTTLAKFERDHDMIVKYMARIDAAIKAINDNSVLHNRTLETNTNAITSNNKLMQIVTYVMILLVVAIIILAGAEKTFEYIKLLRIP